MKMATGSREVIKPNRIKPSSLIAGFIICAALNIGTDMTIATVPVAGDIVNTVIDLFLEIVQIGIIFQLSKHGIKYVPK